MRTTANSAAIILSILAIPILFLFGMGSRIGPRVSLSLALIAVILLAPSFPTFAQAVAANAPAGALPSAIYVPQPVWTEFNQLIVAVIAALVALIWKWIDTHSPLKNTQAEALARAGFTQLLDNAAKFGMSQLEQTETRVGTVNVGNPMVAAAANFVIDHGPDLAKAVGVDITSEDGRAAIVRSVTLRISDALTKSAQAAQAPGSVPIAPKPITLPDSVMPSSRALAVAKR